MADGGAAPRPRTASGGVAVAGPGPRPGSGRNRPRTHARALCTLAAALLLAAAGLFGAGTAAQAQSTLVSNTGETSDTGTQTVGYFTTFKFSNAQAFTTGANADGYTLSEVKAKFGGDTNDSAQVSIYSATPGGAPNASLFTLQNPNSFTANGINTFKVSGTETLTASTTYFVVFEISGSSGDYVLARTASDSEDAGKASGWSIGDAAHWRNQDANAWATNAQSYALQIQIVGSEASATSTDATLSGLALENADDSAAISLNETFAAATTSYTASVANAVETITVTPTKSDSGASIAWLDGANATLADADDNEDGHQVALSVGANTIKVKVTAEDGSTTQTYTITVTRAAAQAVSALVSNTGQAHLQSYDNTLLAQKFHDRRQRLRLRRRQHRHPVRDAVGSGSTCWCGYSRWGTITLQTANLSASTTPTVYGQQRQHLRRAGQRDSGPEHDLCGGGNQHRRHRRLPASPT